jgi:Fe-S oxidoreductase
MQHLLGVDIRRSMPRLVSKTFQKWFHQHMNDRHLSKEKVIFWDDTFLSYNEPEIGRATVAVLEAIGFEVIILKDRKCCGRPMISKGLLKEARDNAIHNVMLLLPYVKDGISIVGVEPGCISMFRDEYLDLLNNEEAKLVARQSFLIEEFLVNLAEKGKLSLTWKESRDFRDILVHGHCYQKAMNGMQHLLKMFKMIPGTSVEEIDCGCCGMAGSFGYEKEHYDISMKCGEDRLFPKIREAPENCYISAAGTSCRHQILDGTGRKAEHPIVLFARALLGAELAHYLE